MNTKHALRGDARHQRGSGRYRWGIGLLAAMLASLTLLGLGSEPVDAQITQCTAADEASLEICIGNYASTGASELLEISILDDISLTQKLSPIEAGHPDAVMVIRGNGKIIDGGSSLPYGFIVDSGSVTFIQVTIANVAGPAIQVDGGSIQVQSSTFDTNGIGISVPVEGDTVVVRDSTFVGNTTAAVYLNRTAAFEIRRSTIVDNPVRGLWLSSSTAVLEGNLIAGSPFACAFDNNTITSSDNISDQDCGPISASNGLAGTYASALADNGCSDCAQTIAILMNSPAFDAATSCGNALQAQRGVTRPAGECDAGAFEIDKCTNQTFVVTNEAELADAITCYNNAPSGATIEISLANDLALTVDPPAIANWASPRASLDFDGSNHTLDTSALSGSIAALLVDSGDLDLSHLHLFGNGSIAGMAKYTGEVTVRQSTFEGLSIGVLAVGGPPHGTLGVSDSTFFGNTAGLYATIGAIVDVDRSTFAANVQSLHARSSSSVTLSGNLILAGDDFGGCGTYSSSAEINLVDGGGNIVDTISCYPLTSTPQSQLDPFYTTALADNGCVAVAPCTPTLEITGGPAVNANNSPSCSTFGLVDQRGFDRAVGACDAGAFERLASCADQPFIVLAQSDLFDAITCYDQAQDGETVNAVFGADLALTSTLPLIANTNGAAMQIDGAGHTLTSNVGMFTLLNVTDGLVAITDLSMTGAVTGNLTIGVLHSGGIVTLRGTTFQQSVVGAITSGAAANEPFTVLDSTFTDLVVAGIVADSDALVKVHRSTLVGNNRGVLMQNTTTVSLSGTLMADNVGGNCASWSNTTVVDDFGNVIDDSSCGAIATTSGVVGTYGTLADNGCVNGSPCTPTIEIFSNSPAVDVNDSLATCTATVVTDQRGTTRPTGACDAGAYEIP